MSDPTPPATEGNAASTSITGTDGNATTQQPWPTDSTQYRLLSKIGQGAFASVYKGVLTEDETRDCAIKVLNLDHCETNLVEIRQEVQAMRLSLHDNVLPCYTAFVSDVNLWLVTPLMQKGSSLHLLQTARRIARKENKIIPHMEEHICYILHQALVGLQYIHSQGQIHRDMKGGNILLDADGHVRIADFGVSGWLVEGGCHKGQAKTFVGTPCWMAPEVMEQIHGYDYKADIWSLGITALELAKGYAPYARYPPMKVLILTIQEDPPSLETYDNADEIDELDAPTEDEGEQWSKSFKSLVALLLQKDPTKRPTCDELLQSQFFSPMNVAERKEAIKDEVCDLVPDIGLEKNVAGKSNASSSNSDSSKKPPGYAPVSIVLDQAEDRPAGTTWVFEDGSQVLASTQTEVDDEDVFNELDQFGENYTRGEKTTEEEQGTTTPTTTEADNAEDEEKDDLNDFMDEFEQTTGGENFRK
mmetsp:Transcript_6716/g.9487  ORF Transcript_6716/g.9487 Transcript_6716/m.9487 type:complete len:474 (-) Transcript_6716:1273-2694(-)